MLESQLKSKKNADSSLVSNKNFSEIFPSGTEVGKLWPAGHMQPARAFCAVRRAVTCT